MKIKAGEDVDIGGSVRSGKKQEPFFWQHFREIAWLGVIVALTTASIILYAASGEIEVADLFVGLIGIAIAQFIKQSNPID